MLTCPMMFTATTDQSEIPLGIEGLEDSVTR